MANTEVSVNDSILKSVRKMVGPSHDCDVFDVDLIAHINTVLFALNQMGVGKKEGFEITDDTATWSDFVGMDVKQFHAVKSYMFLKVRLLFDPPASSVIVSAMERLANEYEWRLNVNAESQNDSETG